MRLLSLEVEHFGCVRHAALALGPGLNVLFGPNDIGKSTLAAALRAALLLPHGSSEADAFVPWRSDTAPRVALVFQLEPDCVWRVTKSFGSGSRGSSLLERARDVEALARHATTEAKARAVDGKLRELLPLGLPSPGGRGGPRGLPKSFLSTVLFGEQAEVAAVFRASLAGDPDESGKQRLVRALEALAQDPLFRAVLRRVQARVDEAFTATGKKRSGREAPLTRAAERIRAADAEARALADQAERSEGVRGRVLALEEERVGRQAALDEARATRAGVASALSVALAQRALAGRLAAARAERERREGVLRAVELARARAGVLAQAHAARAADAQRAHAQCDVLEAGAARARAALARVADEAGERGRERARRDVEAALLTLDVRAGELRAALERARVAVGAGARASALEAERALVERGLVGQRGELDAAEEAAREGAAREVELADLELFVRWRQASGALAAAEARRGERDALAADAAARGAEIERRAASRAERQLPTASELAALEELARELELARARLGVGLTASVRPARPLALRARADGAEAASETLAEPAVYRARGRLELSFAALVEVVIEGGSEADRVAASELALRFEREVAPRLACARAPDVRALGELCRAADEDARDSARERAELSRRQGQLAAFGDVDALVARCAGDAARRVEALTGRDRRALARRARALGEDAHGELERGRAEVRAAIAAAHARREQARIDLAAAQARGEALARELAEAVRARAAALEALGASVGARDAALGEQGASAGEAAERELVRVERQLAALDAERAALGARLERLAREGEQTLALARAQSEAAARASAQARERLSACVLVEQRAAGELDSQRGRVEAQAEAADAIDVEGARAAERQLAAELAQHPAAQADEADLARAERELATAAGHFAETQRELATAHGALGQVGGAVVRERHAAALEALELARRGQHELELDCDAWQLLRDTLRAAESAESAHLGRALVAPLAERFAAVTGGRYGALELGPDLKSGGVEAAGELRDVLALSVGTREQLATLLRVLVAEELGTALLLDDQLAQSDAERMGALGRLLRAAAERIQIVVLTCRPGDYLAAAERPRAGELQRDDASARVRALDLARIVERAG